MSAQDEEQTRDLQCPKCGYLLVNDTSIGAKYCGPHVDSRGNVIGPAVQMRTIRDWGEFTRSAQPDSSPSVSNSGEKP